MATVLEIEGQLVRTIERNVINEVPLADMLEHLERRPPVILPALPRNRTLGVFWDESNSPERRFNIAIAKAPSVRTIPLGPGYRTNGENPRLALPWTIFCFQMTTAVENPRGQDWRMGLITFWFSKDEPTGADTDNLIPALLPNIYYNAGICWGNTGVPAIQPLNDRIDQTVNEFYQTEFTHGGDIENNWPYYRATHKRWARETEEVGPGCFQNWTDWEDDRRQHKTLKEVLGITTDITQPLVLRDGIPNIPVNPTFGRAEEWARELTNNQRIRLETVLANLRTENADLFTATNPIIVNQILDDEDD